MNKSSPQKKLITDGTNDVLAGFKRMEIEDIPPHLRLTRTPSHEELLRNQDLVEWSGTGEDSNEDSPSLW